MAQNGLWHRAEIIILGRFLGIVGPKMPTFVGKPLFLTHFHVIEPNQLNSPHLDPKNPKNRPKMVEIMENRAKMAYLANFDAIIMEKTNFRAISDMAHLLGTS